MAQQVFTQAKRVQLHGPGPVLPFAVEPSTPVGQALADGWQITHVSTTVMGEYHLSTFVLEKADPSNMQLG